MDKILDGLYLGDLEDANAAMDQMYTVNFCEIDSQHQGPKTHFPVPDNTRLDVRTVQNGVWMVENAIYTGRTVLVHCRMGQSRAPSFVFGYLVGRCNWDADYALDYIKKCRDFVNPYIKTLNSVRTCYGYDPLPGDGFLWP